MSTNDKLKELVEILAKFSDKLANNEDGKKEIAKAIHDYVHSKFGDYTRKLNKDIKRAENVHMAPTDSDLFTPWI